MAFVFTVPLRIAQGVVTVCVLGLTGYVASWWTGYWHDSAPSEINFLLFSSVFTLLSLAYLVVVPWRFSQTFAGHKFAILAAEAITMVCWFGGFIALAVFLSNRVCFGQVCNVARASVALASFEWLFFATTTTMATMHVLRTHGVTARADRTTEVTEAAKNHA